MPHESTLFSSQVRRRLEERTANAEEKVRQLEVDFAAYKSKAETESRKLTVTVRELKHQLRHSEQRVKAKETVLERLQEKLRTLVDLEKKGRERDRETFARIQRRKPDGRRPHDSKMLEIISAYETRREQSENELQGARRQLRELNESLREKDNFILHQGYGVSEKSFDWLLEDPSSEGGGGGPGSSTSSSMLDGGPGDRGHDGAIPMSYQSLKAVIQKLTDRYREQNRVVRAHELRETAYKKQIDELKQKLRVSV